MDNERKNRLSGKLFILIFISIMIFTISGCTSLQGQTSSISTSPIPTTSPQTNIPTTTVRPIENHLSLSRAPKLGETAELTYTLNIKDEAQYIIGQTLDKTKVWIDFEWTDIHGSYSTAKHTISIPLNEVLVSGDVNWEGNALENRTAKVIDCIIQLPREGIWKINVHFTNWDTGYLQVAIADGDAAFMSSEEFSLSPLGYLDNFPYGRWTDRVLNESSDPILLALDISKAPKLGEEAVLTCRITSLHDVADLPTKITFSTWQKATTGTEIPGTNLLVNGDLEWRGSLKVGEPIEFSATIKFPEEGDWLIHGQGDILTNGTGSADEIRMNITRDRGSFGWKQYVLPTPTNGITIPPIPTSGLYK
jgi:hypothetical protein